MKWLIMTVLFYYGSCDDTMSVREQAATRRPVANRIAGGQPTTIEKYPYMAYLSIFTKELGPRRWEVGSCGGVLLTPCHVLTAAHCDVHENGTLIKPHYVNVRTGSTYSDRGGSKHQVSRTVIHEGYNSTTYDNDVAVVVLSSNISNFKSSTVQPASIPPAGYKVPDNASVVAIGWGRTDEDCETSAPRGLRHVEVRKVSWATCAARHEALGVQEGDPSRYIVTENMMCAGLLDIGGASTCMGDSGGPLEYNGVVVGVTSWGARCADPVLPGVFARVANYRTWITNTVQTHNSVSTADVDFSLLLLSSLPYLFAISEIL